MIFEPYSVQELASLLTVVSAVDPDMEVVAVAQVPPGFSWCVHGRRIFIAGELLAGHAGHALRAAATELLDNLRNGLRAPLIALQGGQEDTDDGDAPRLRVAGS